MGMEAWRISKQSLASLWDKIMVWGRVTSYRWRVIPLSEGSLHEPHVMGSILWGHSARFFSWRTGYLLAQAGPSTSFVVTFTE
ncbi:hypothetical protein AVEN_263762-1 [Araneus ventricosus]|uniref:Uncharacterized protein n=1 Tax=Araneus ventricosus TaxID=182803 RepID=A0A4Y2AS52_ARAVE|nr:hypothetical protein AVEN_263762-1 [Araneus ventricosus]